MYFGLFKNHLETALNKKCKTYVYLKSTKEQLKVEWKQYKMKLNPYINGFLQCFCSSKSWHLLSNSSVSFFHSFSSTFDGFRKHNHDKPIGSNSDDLHISRNTIWKIILNVFSEFLKQVFIKFIHFSSISSNCWISKKICQLNVP